VSEFGLEPLDRGERFTESLFCRDRCRLHRGGIPAESIGFFSQLGDLCREVIALGVWLHRHLREPIQQPLGGRVPDTAMRVSRVRHPLPTIVRQQMDSPTETIKRPSLIRRVTKRPSAPYIVLVIIGVLLANALPLSKVVDNTPFENRIHLQTKTPDTWMRGFYTIDPNDGFTAEALGKAALRSWLHGDVPYWNSNEGLGTPLAGEMQSGAFSPFVVLMAFHRGLLFEHVLLEMIAGIATLLFLRRLKIHMVAATACALLFALNGTHAWLTNAVFAPIAFLPVVLLGVERAVERSKRGDPAGFGLIAAGLGLSLVAGFPEIAYIDALLVALWSVIRLFDLPRNQRLALLRKLGAGAILGAMLAAPALIAFVDFLGQANVGGHAGGFAESSLQSGYLFTVLMPYASGPVFGSLNGSAGEFWSSVGGYLGTGIVVLALYGVLERRFRRAKVVLLLFALAILARVFGIIHLLITLWNTVPGIDQTAFFRYSPPALAFATVILAAFGLDRICRGDRRWRDLGIAAGVSIVLLMVASLQARTAVRVVTDLEDRHVISLISIVGASLIAVALLACIALAPRTAATRFIAAGVVVFEAIVLFALPQMSAARNIALDQQPILFLHANLGTQRFYSLGPIAPNYGSYLGLAQLNVNDLPTPKRWDAYVAANLSQNADPSNFTGTYSPAGNLPDSLHQFYANITGYTAAGVRYLLVARDSVPITDAGEFGLHKVFTSPTTDIFELSGVQTYFSSDSCTLTYSDRAEVSADCPKASTLTRLELSMPGWTAEVNGNDVAVATIRETFQGVALPAGKSTVTFDFQPPHIRLAWIACVVAVLVLFGTHLESVRQRFRRVISLSSARRARPS